MTARVAHRGGEMIADTGAPAGRHRMTVVLAGVLALALASCKGVKNPVTGALPAGTSHVLTVTTTPTPVCVANGPPASGDIIQVVRVIIETPDAPNAVRHVWWKPPLPDESSHDNDTDGAIISPIDRENPFDVDLTQLPKPAQLGKSRKYIEVRVVNKDKDYTLYYGAGVSGVMSGNPANEAGLCGAMIDQASPNVAVVYAPAARPGSTTVRQGFYAVGLIPRLAVETPVFVVPKIQNNG
jgi:hypothetical protein